MPPRYNQGQIASPVVGTPGVDPSAGKGAEIAAQSIDRMREAETAAAIGQFRQAEQSFNAARGSFFYAQQQNFYNARQKKLEEDEQRRLQVQFDLLDEHDRVAGVVADLQSRHKENPFEAVKEFQTKSPQMREEFQQKYGGDPLRLRMLMPAQRQKESAAVESLRSWATQTVNDNLNRRLSLLPEQLSQKIDNLSGSFVEQLTTFRQQLENTNGIYTTMRESAVTQAHSDQVATKQINLNHEAARQFKDHLLAQIPVSEDGLNQLGFLEEIAKTPHKFGIPLESKDHKTFVGEIQTARTHFEKQITTNIQTDGFIKVADAKIMRLALDDAQSDPIAMSRIDKQIKDQARAVGQQIKLAEREPNETIRKAKVLALKQELSELVGGAEKETSAQRALESIERSRRGEARAIQGMAMSIIRFQQGQEDRTKRVEEGKIVEEFNGRWTNFLTASQRVLGQGSGPEQQLAMEKVARNAVQVLDDAVATGAITSKEYGTRMNQVKAQMNLVSGGTKTVDDKFLGMIPTGGKRLVPLTDKEKKVKAAELQTQFGQLVTSEVGRLNVMKSSVGMLKTLTRDASEHAFLESYLYTNLPRVLEAQSYQKLPQEKKDAFRANFIRNAVTRFRAGNLE